MTLVFLWIITWYGRIKLCRVYRTQICTKMLHCPWVDITLTAAADNLHTEYHNTILIFLVCCIFIIPLQRSLVWGVFVILTAVVLVFIVAIHFCCVHGCYFKEKNDGPETKKFKLLKRGCCSFSAIIFFVCL